ncbi:MAG: hypothetical protein IT479_03420 [Xanthomonadales bacterium]|nr:hypothetical protein [Xanthomonadales bacterium]MCC6592300.1 hypothetical protein [Xanthomonadales bacterium]MCE7931645.1 hypothetical protein [Xanthomonadales bacterium PRO6]
MRSPANPDADTPFWDRLRPILAYPMQFEALLTIGLLAALRLFGQFPGAAGWIMNLIITVALLKYAAEVLVATANGNLDAPTGYATPDAVGWNVLKVQVLLWVVAILSMIALAAAGAGWLSILPLLLVALGAPAALISAAIDGDPWVALNPALWLATMSRIGWPYIGASLLCLVIMISETNAQRLLLPFVPGPLAVIVHYFIAHYATVVTFHLLGYLVWQYRDALGYEVKQTEVRKPLPRPQDKDQAILDQAEARVIEGDTQGAAQLLGEHIAERGGSDVMHQRYRKLLALHNDAEALAKHARTWLNVMIAQERWRQALDFWAEVRGADANLWPSDPDQVLELIDKAHELGRPELSLPFGSGFSRVYPRHPTVGAVHHKVALALGRHLGRPADALKLLETTREGYPKSKALPDIEQLIEELKTDPRVRGGA